jgi:DNA-binding response OmpR family regulator
LTGNGALRMVRHDGLVMFAALSRSTIVALPRNRSAPRRAVGSLEVADLVIDALQRHVRQGAHDVHLSPQEHILLYTLAANASAAVGYRELAEALGQTDADIRRNTLARHVSSLRRKLGDDATRPRYIESVVGVGYRLLGARS